MKRSARLLGGVVASCVAVGGLVGAQGATASTTDAGSTTVQQAATQTMTVKTYIYPSSRNLTVGQTASYTGTVTKGPRGTKVQFQHYQGGRWVTLGTSTVSSTGKFAVRAKPTSPGVRKIRLVIGGNSTYKTYRSYAHTLRVYRWRYLSDLTELTGDMDTGGYTVNGAFYSRSLAGYFAYDDPGENDYMDYNIGRKCSQLQYTAGIADDSRSPRGRVTFEAWADSSLRSTKTLSYGQSAPITVSVAGYLRLSLKAVNHVDEGSSTIPVFGNARVLCAS